MQNLKENQELKQYRDKFDRLTGEIRSLNENLLYASFYDEKEAFYKYLKDLKDAWMSLYNQDRILESLIKEEENA